MKNKCLWSWVLVLAGALLFASCSEKNKQTERPPVQVKVDKVKNFSGGSQSGQFSGVVAASKTVNISPQISGTILQVPVKEGSYVKKGELLAKVESDVYNNQYEVHKARLKMAEEAYKRVKKVYDNGSISEIQMLEAKSNYEQALAAAKAASHQVESGKIQAPVDGFVSNIQSSVGALAAPGVLLMQLIDISSVDINMAVSAGEIGLIKQGGKAIVTIPDLGGQEIDAEITEVSVNSPTGAPSYLVRINIPNPDLVIRPGMHAKVRFQGGPAISKSATNKFDLPAHVVQIDSRNQNFVLVLNDSSNRAVRKDVDVLGINGDFLSVQGGLKPDDFIIASGFHKITNNTKVAPIK